MIVLNAMIARIARIALIVHPCTKNDVIGTIILTDRRLTGRSLTGRRLTARSLTDHRLIGRRLTGRLTEFRRTDLLLTLTAVNGMSEDLINLK